MSYPLVFNASIVVLLSATPLHFYKYIIDNNKKLAGVYIYVVNVRGFSNWQQ